MKVKTLAALVACSGLLVAAGAPAVAADLKATGCLNCHDAEKKKMGPSFKDIKAKKPKADEVVAKMKEGKGHPKQNKPESDLKAAVEEVLK